MRFAHPVSGSRPGSFPSWPREDGCLFDLVVVVENGQYASTWSKLALDASLSLFLMHLMMPRKRLM